MALFAGLRFYVAPMTAGLEGLLPQRDSIISLLKAHGGVHESRGAAHATPGCTFLVIEPIATPVIEPGALSQEWVKDSVAANRLLPRDAYVLRPLVEPARATKIKPRYTAEDDAKLRDFAAGSALGGLNVWKSAVEKKLLPGRTATSMYERFDLLRKRSLKQEAQGGVGGGGGDAKASKAELEKAPLKRKHVEAAQQGGEKASRGADTAGDAAPSAPDQKEEEEEEEEEEEAADTETEEEEGAAAVEAEDAAEEEDAAAVEDEDVGAGAAPPPAPRPRRASARAASRGGGPSEERWMSDVSLIRSRLAALASACGVSQAAAAAALHRCSGSWTEAAAFARAPWTEQRAWGSEYRPSDREWTAGEDAALVAASAARAGGGGGAGGAAAAKRLADAIRGRSAEDVQARAAYLEVQPPPTDGE